MTESAALAFQDQISLRHPEDGGLVLLDIRHPAIEDLFIAADNRDHVVAGKTYLGWPCTYRFPKADGNGGGKRGALVIQDVDPEIAPAIKALSPEHQPSLRMTLVSMDDPAEVWFDHEGLYLVNVNGTDTLITAEIKGHGQDDAPWPARRATPKRTPGIYVA